MRFLPYLFLLAFFTLSCNQDANQVKTEDALISKAALAEVLDLDKTIEVTLQKEPQKAVSIWIAYITAQNEVKELETATLKELIDNAAPLAKIMTELKETVPDVLASTAVLSRIQVLQTKASILLQLTKRQTLDVEALTKTASEIYRDFEHFKLQLNEVYLKTPDQFEIELDDRLDSIQKADTENKQKISEDYKELGEID